MPEDCKRVTIILSEEDHRRLRLIASTNNLSVEVYIRELVGKALETNSPLLKLYKQAKDTIPS